MKKEFIHLHLHTEYSLLDGVGKIEEYVAKAKELKMSSMAITDHGNMYGAIEFYTKLKASGIKPIIGIEVYLAEFSRLEKEGRTFHLVLLAKNDKGYQNLLKITSESFINGFYYKPRIDKEFLKNHSDGIIALSACMHGELSRRIMEKESNDIVDRVVQEYIDIFGQENFFIEIQANEILEQKILNEKLYELAKKHSLELVATNDTHYVNKGEHKLQDIIICIQTGAKITDKKRMRIECEDLYLKEYDEVLEQLGEKFLPAIENTKKIADMCNLDIEFGVLKFPNYEIPSSFKNMEEFLRDLVYKNLKNRYETPDKIVLERVEYELSIIEKMGYAGYFIVVWDFIDYAKKNNIPIGPGRGSAAGSIVAYILRITEVDPIKYNLIFERFLNPERVSMPDIDIDICQEKRQELIEYVIKKYGEDKVAQIITFGTLKARSSIRDVGRVLDIPLTKIDKIAKLVPTNMKLKEVLENIDEFRALYLENRELQQVVDISLRLENKVRHSSTHAAGIVITKDALSETIPVCKENKVISTQYQMKELEELGLLKMDFLGLRNLTNLQRTIDYIKTEFDKDIVLEKIPLNSKEVYEMLGKADTSGVFQLESTGIRRILKKLKPDKFEDIVALLALYRPGPLSSGMVDDFINGKNGTIEIKYPHDTLRDVLIETYGVILYQEQVMKIANIMAGYSLGEADLLRRAMGKKNIKIMEDNREKFIKRSIENGYTKEKAEEIFELIDKFAGYGFNKSHSVAYGLIAYWTAYFKANYPKYYYAALMTSEISELEDIAYYVEDAKRHNIKVFLPSINEATSKFLVRKDGIAYSLSAIKNVGEGIVESIRLEALEGKYKNFEDFVVRNKKYGLNKKNIEALIFSGALDELNGNRKEKILSLDKILERAGKVSKQDDIQQMHLFGEARSVLENVSIVQSKEYSTEELLEKEKEYLGFYFSAHPLDKYRDIIELYRLTSISNIKNEKVRIYGIIRNLKKLVTKKNSEIMCVFDLEDFKNNVNCVAFPQIYRTIPYIFNDGEKVVIEGEIQNDYFNGNERKKIIVKRILEFEKLMLEKRQELYILLQEEDREKFSILKSILQRYVGETKVYFASKDEKNSKIHQSNFHIRVSKELLEELISLLGREKIYIRL